jgi:hypothetical protein
MQSYYTFIALELARERVAEAERDRLARLATRRPLTEPGLVRRIIARAALAVAQAADENLAQRELAAR